MPEVWTAGQVVTGAGSAAALGTWLRVNVTGVPAYIGHTAGTPSLYYNTGRAGWKSDAFYAEYTVLKALQTIIPVPPDIATDVWWDLEYGVTATIYQGREIDVSQAVAARVANSAAQTTTTSVSLTLSFDTVRYDPWGMHAAANPTRLTCKVPGIYDIGAAIQFVANATGNRSMRIILNGTTELARMGTPGSAGGLGVSPLNISCQTQLNVGDYVEVTAFQSSGGNLDVSVVAQSSPEFWMALIPG